MRWATTVAAALTDTATVATLTYDPVSKDLASVGYASGSTGLSVSDLLTRDQAGNPVKTTWTVGTRVFTDTLTRSRAGRIVRAVTTDTSGAGAGASSADWSYVFDGAARLTRATLAAAGTRPKLTLDYGYASSGGCGADTKAGANGSRTSFTRTLGSTAQTSSVCTDNAARTTAVTSSTGGTAIPATQITWDARGNATRIGNQTWTYDAAGRVTTSNEATGLQALTYTRDATGRVTKRAATSTTGGDQSLTLYGYAGDGDTPDVQLTPTGAISEAYLNLPGGALLTRTTTGTSTWAISNLHGDLIATLTVTATGAGTTTAGYLYDPFGQPLNPATLAVDTNAVPDTRAGAPTDAWAGVHQRAYEHTGGLNQHLMGARTYLPTLGTFTSTDPIPGGNTTTYTYPQDPINHQDYSGLRQDIGEHRTSFPITYDIPYSGSLCSLCQSVIGFFSARSGVAAVGELAKKQPGSAWRTYWGAGEITEASLVVGERTIPTGKHGVGWRKNRVVRGTGRLAKQGARAFGWPITIGATALDYMTNPPNFTKYWGELRRAWS